MIYMFKEYTYTVHYSQNVTFIFHYSFKHCVVSNLQTSTSEHFKTFCNQNQKRKFYLKNLQHMLSISMTVIYFNI